MTIVLYRHPDIFLHDQAAHHVAMDSQRLAYIDSVLTRDKALPTRLARVATAEELLRNHTLPYLQQLAKTRKLDEGHFLQLNAETVLNRHTWRTTVLSAGAVCQAVDDVKAGATQHAFCMGYAGHHALASSGGGFCFTNQVAIGAHHALAQGFKHVAILDFDTHSGNGTVLSFLADPRVLFAETYQPGYPGEFLADGTLAPSHLVRLKCRNATQFQHAWEHLLKHVRSFGPDIILVSAGFDAHVADPLGTIGVKDDHYTWLAGELAQLGAPVIATLEGGYSLPDTARCAALFVTRLGR
jgi:acetoin utilization deacetylase AcuC-like enzyme